MQFYSNPDTIKQLNKQLRLDLMTIRHGIIKLDDKLGLVDDKEDMRSTQPAKY